MELEKNLIINSNARQVQHEIDFPLLCVDFHFLFLSYVNGLALDLQSRMEQR